MSNDFFPAHWLPEPRKPLLFHTPRPRFLLLCAMFVPLCFAGGCISLGREDVCGLGILDLQTFDMNIVQTGPDDLLGVYEEKGLFYTARFAKRRTELLTISFDGDILNVRTCPRLRGEPCWEYGVVRQISPDGRLLLYVTGNSLRLVYVEIGEARAVVDDRQSTDIQSLWWLTDTEAVIVSGNGMGQRDNSILRIDVESGRVRTAYHGANMGGRIAVSPDRQKVAFCDVVDANGGRKCREVRVLDLHTEQVSVVKSNIDDPAYFPYLLWDASSQELLYTVGEDAVFYSFTDSRSSESPRLIPYMTADSAYVGQDRVFLRSMRNPSPHTLDLWNLSTGKVETSVEGLDAFGPISPIRVVAGGRKALCSLMYASDYLKEGTDSRGRK